MAHARLPRPGDLLLHRLSDHLPAHASLSFTWSGALLNLDFTRACECALTAYRARQLLNPNPNLILNLIPNLNPNSWRSTPPDTPGVPRPLIISCAPALFPPRLLLLLEASYVADDAEAVEDEDLFETADDGVEVRPS